MSPTARMQVHHVAPVRTQRVQMSPNALATLTALARHARPNGLITLGIPGRADTMAPLRTPQMLAGVDELLERNLIALAGANVIRAQNEIVLDVSRWLERHP